MRRRKQQEMIEQALKVALEKTTSIYDSILRQVLRQNQLLMDRLMAKDYKEFRTFERDEPTTEERINFRDIPLDADELNAGEILNVD